MILLFYAKPSLQFEYLHKVIGVGVKSSLKDAWIELKATRDLIVHNSGIINEMYLQKCGALSRGQTDEQIKIDKYYFERSLASAKSLIGTISSQLQKTFNVKK